MLIVTAIKHDIKMRYLERRFNSIVKKMKKHESDIDETEWKKWASLGIDCLKAMDSEMCNCCKKD